MTTESPAEEIVLVATRDQLGVIRADGMSAEDGPTVEWTAWPAVHLASDDLWYADEDGGDRSLEFRLAIRVGSRTYHAASQGAAGKAALRDLVVAVQSGRERTRSRHLLSAWDHWPAWHS